MSEYFYSKNAVVAVDLEQLKELQQKLIAAGNASGVLGARVIANTAAIGRRAAKDLESSKGHRMGGTYLKYNGRTAQLRGTVFDSKLGGWKSTSDGRRTMGFNFENYEARRSKTAFRRAVSQISMYSLVANLFEESHVWSKMSPGWEYEEKPGTVFRRPAGYVSKAYQFFLSDVKSRIVASMASAIARTESEFDMEEEIKKV